MKLDAIALRIVDDSEEPAPGVDALELVTEGEGVGSARGDGDAGLVQGGDGRVQANGLGVEDGAGGRVGRDCRTVGRGGDAVDAVGIVCVGVPAGQAVGTFVEIGIEEEVAADRGGRQGGRGGGGGGIG